MNGLHNRKGKNQQQPFPGCMGRMINIFDSSSGMPRNKLLTEKAYNDVSPIQTSRQDVVKMKAMDDTTIIGKKRSTNISNGTPIKMLIAQEMSREPQSQQKPSNVVAKLMGLDMLPVQQSTPSARSLPDAYPHKSSSREFQGHLKQDNRSCHSTLQFETKYGTHESKFKDVYEVRQQPSRHARFRDKLAQNIEYDDSPTERRMCLVRQKFTEAKRLATDDKLLQSKEFQEALEVLSSNRDLFLKFLEGPNALFSKHHPESQSVPHVSQAKCITVLKPSRPTESKGETQDMKFLHPVVKDIDPDMKKNRKSSRSSNFVHHRAESMSEPTRIVVLKPNPAMSHETSAGVASLVISSKPLESQEYHGSLEPDEATNSRQLAKEITRQMQEYMSGNQKDESMVSSALSNGYVGDESSFNMSENDYIQEKCDNVSDLESVTPTSRHSWDYSCRSGSPFSVSSFSRASYSPEPSVIKEAKKRLSERLAMVSSNVINQGQSQVQRVTSTLGEMLSIAEVKRGGANNTAISSNRSCVEEQDQRISAAHSSFDAMEGFSDDPLRNLARSKSVPTSSSVYENIGLSVTPKEVITKPKGGMSFLREKVSNLLLSRIKKAGKEKPLPSCSLDSDHSEASAKQHAEGRNLVNTERKTGMVPPSTSSNGPNHGNFNPKVSLPSEKSNSSENSRESQDQPSPISILDAPFKDDASSSICQPSPSIILGHPQALSRSSPIGSISRTLTWENPRETNSLKPSRVLSRECEEQERSLLVQDLLSCAGLVDNGYRSTVLAGWHSLESPLDPILLDEFLERKEEEANCSERRSNHRLLFDCVNAALLSIAQTNSLGGYPWTKAYSIRAPVAEEVLRLVKDLYSCEKPHVSVEPENQNLLVDRLIKGELAGRGWAESICLEVDEFSREVSGRMLEELVEEALADLTDECL